MYVIYPADEVVYLTYGTVNPVRVKPRPTLDNLCEPQVPFRLPSRAPAPTATATASAVESPGTPPADIFDYGGPHAASSKPPRVDASRARPDKKPKRRFLRLKKSEDPDFGRTLRSPNAFDCERPAPLPTPAFSKKNIFDRDFEALFEVSHCPEFAEHVRVITPDPICPSRETEEEAAQIHEEEFQKGEETDLWDTPSPVEDLERKDFLRVPPHSAPSTPRPEKKIIPPRVSRPPLPVAKSSSLEEPNRKRAGFFSRIRHRSADSRSRMSGGVQGESVLRDITHPALNEHLKNHNAVSFKLVKTVSDFTSQLSQMYEQQAGELQMLVASYRKKNGELRKERPACPSSLFHTWETLLQEVEADSQAHSDVAAALDRHVARPLIERTFHRKLQARKVFAHRDGCDTIIAKTEEKLTKCRQEYKAAHQAYSQSPSQATMAGFMDGHNSYVQQLHATNGMLDEYNQETLPHLLQELEEIYSDLCNTLSEAVLQGAEVVSSRASEQARRYDGLSAQCRALSGTADLAHLARALPTPAAGRPPRRPFAPPNVIAPTRNHHDGADVDPADAISLENQPPQLKDELVLERLGPMQIRSNHDSLRKEALDLEIQIKQLQDSLDAMVRMQQRSLEGHLYNKVNELQEDISMKKFDLRVAQIHLSAVKAQKELFAAKADAGTVDRKLSSTSAGSMKNKWLKAFKSLKPAQSAPPSQPAQPTQPIDKKNGGRDLSRSGAELESHNFLEYTYKKITPCDVCSQVLRGHTRQGLRCRMCKMNVHSDCLGSAGRCQTKSRLLRRQKSTSEIEARIQDQTLDEEKMGGTGTRPFGQPLCFVQDTEEPYSPVKSKKNVKRKK